jgi:16S rRNA (uracil1498-N3)-methyltransferase
MHHLFFSDQQVNQSPIPLSKDIYHHLQNVVRIKSGEKLHIVTESRFVEAKITALSKQGLSVTEVQSRPLPQKKRPFYTLGQCLPKADKLSDILRACTELGVAHFIPLTCERSVPKIDKIQEKSARWMSIIDSAASQSKQLSLPTLSPITPLLTINHDNYDLKVVFWENETQSLKTCLKALSSSVFNNVLVIIGPEGGLSDTEIKDLKDQGFYSVSLGSTVLRVEHAALAAFSQLQFAFS